MSEKTKTQLPVTAILHIVYINTKGEMSERMITARSFDPDAESGMLKAFCHWRRQVRSFKYSAMSEITVADTGEMISCENLPEYLHSLYLQSPERMLDIFLEDNKPVVTLLTYVMHCDGKMAAVERAKIVDWILDSAELDEDVEKLVHSKIRKWEIPTKTDFIKAAATIKTSDEYDTDMVLEQAKIVADADGKLHEEENSSLAFLERFFNSKETV